MDELKSVRVRRRMASLDERHGSLDIKVTVYKGLGKRRISKGLNNGTIVWPESVYDDSKTLDEIIKDFIRVNTLRERPTGATISVFNSNTGKQESSDYYVIVQDPWSDTVPAQRSFGFDPYYLSNGSEVYVKWLTESYDKMQYDISGMTASIVASGSSASVTKIVVDVLPSYSKYPDFDLKFDYNGGSQSEIDSAVSNVVNQSINTGFTINGITYPKEGENITSSLTYLMNGGEQYSDLNMKEINTPTNIIKRVEVIPPRSESGELVDKIWTITDNNEFKYLSDISSDATLKQMSYSYGDKDSSIIQKLIDNWVVKVPVYKAQASLVGVGLMLCNPSYQSCLYTNYQSPIKPIEPESKPIEDPIVGSNSTTKTKLSVVFPTEFEVKVREDVPAFKIYIGDPPKEEEGAFMFQDDLADQELLSDEYKESIYVGAEELGITPEEFIYEEKIAGGQEDSTKVTPEQAGPDAGKPVEIKPVSSFDALINLAGKCARELGKNGRVNATNMKMGYTKDIHGLCPQGTQAVLYALTGIKAVGQITGNADWFSFGPTNPKGGVASFSKTGYYKDKIKIQKSSGKDWWKGTYIDPANKKDWQVGDVIAMAYTGRSYGHIQVWTGYSWMSDFKQGNSIQKNHVNPDSVALWRLNDKGIEAVKKQSK